MRLQVSILYISAGDVENAESSFSKIGLASIPSDEVFSLHTMFLRFAMAMNEAELYKKHLQMMNSLKNISFDNQSQLQFYQAVNLLLFETPSESRVSEVS